MPMLAAGHRQEPLYSATGGRSRNGPNARIVANGARPPAIGSAPNCHSPEGQTPSDKKAGHSVSQAFNRVGMVRGRSRPFQPADRISPGRPSRSEPSRVQSCSLCCAAPSFPSECSSRSGAFRSCSSTSSSSTCPRTSRLGPQGSGGCTRAIPSSRNQRVIDPPEWAAFSLLSVGAVTMLYAVALPKKQSRSVRSPNRQRGRPRRPHFDGPGVEAAALAARRAFGADRSAACFAPHDDCRRASAESGRFQADSRITPIGVGFPAFLDSSPRLIRLPQSPYDRNRK